MLKAKTVERIRGLLADGLTERVVAREAGVSRGAVRNVKAHGDYVQPFAKGSRHLPGGRVGTCPTCLARVYLPCRACEVREAMAAGTLYRFADRDGDDEVPALDLHDDDAARLKEVRDARGIQPDEDE